MKVKIWFSKIDAIGGGSETSIIDFQPSPVPPALAEPESLAELETAVTAYAAQATLLGHCGRVYVTKQGTGRAFSGFNQRSTRGVLVNKEVGEAAYAPHP